MTSVNDLPVFIRLGLLWNRIGPRGRGYVPRKIGKLYDPNTDYMIETAHGAKLRLDLSNLDAYAPIYNAQGRWEPHVVSACAHILRANEVFFDIGANAGIVTLEIRALLGEMVSICSFEPQPSLAESLRRSLAINAFTNVKVFECLLSNFDGAADLYLTSHAIHASMIPRERTFEKISRPAYKLDTLIKNWQCPSPHVVKMDTEGAEMAIVKGMVETIKRECPTIIFEADENMERFGYAANDLLDMLKSIQPYRFYSILTNGQLQPWAPRIASDVLAVGPTHHDRITEEWLSQ